MSRYFPDLKATNATSGGVWEKNTFTGSYVFHYPCGHNYEVPATVMQMGGQVAPPICPACHGQRAIDQMEAENWHRNPKWQGYAPQSLSKKEAAGIMGLDKASNTSGPIAWLDYQVGVVRQKAWR